MHIANNVVTGAICPTTAIISGLGLALFAGMAIKSKKGPSALNFSFVTALIFALQMLNFPISGGTSGHLIGGILAVTLLGLPFGVLSLAIVLVVQTLAFGDGGLSVLGLNILNMSLIAGGIGGYITNKFISTPNLKFAKLSAIILGSMISVTLAAIACSFEIAISGSASISSILVPMVSTHLMIGLVEGIITYGVYSIFKTFEVKEKSYYGFGLLAVIGALLISPFASSHPDGLEWVIETYTKIHVVAPNFVTPLTDYSFSYITNEFLSVFIAGLIGVSMVILISYSLINIKNRITK